MDQPTPLSLPIDGVRSGLLGGLSMDKEYMAGVKSRARMLAKACAVKQHVEIRPRDPYVDDLRRRK